MNREPYLWDKSGPAVPFVARLERLLAAKRAEVMLAGGRTRLRSSRRAAWVLAATAAGVVIWLCMTNRAREERTPAVAPPPLAVEASPPSLVETEATAVENVEKPTLPPAVGAEPATDAPSDPTATKAR